MAEEFSINLGIELNTNDLNNIRNQLNNFNNNQFKIRIDADTTRIQKQINSIRMQLQNLGKIKINLGGNSSGGGNSSVNNTVNNMNWAYKQMLDIQKKASSLSIKINSIDTSNNINELKELSLQFARLRSDYETLRKTFGGNLSTTQWGNLQAVLTDTEDKLLLLDAKVADTKAKLAKDITVKLDTNTFNNDISNLESNFNKLRVKSDEVKNGMQEVRTAFNDMKIASNNKDIDGLISAYDRYKIALKDVGNQIKINIRTEQEAFNTQKLTDAKTNLSLKMDKWLKDNSAAASQFGSKIKDLQLELKSCDSVRFTGIKSEFQQIKLQADLAGKATKSLGDKFKESFSRLTTYFSTSAIIFASIHGLKEMYNNVVKIDSAMTELKKVTDATDSQFAASFEKSKQSAKDFGTTLSDIISATADWSRLGYSLNQAEELARVSALYRNVGDNIDINTANESLISTLRGFQLDASEAESIIDKFNEVANNYAIDSAGIGEALQRSAASFNAANTDLSKSIALITGANEVVQDPTRVGNMWKTVGMRIRSTKQELEKAGEDTDGMVESTAKLRELVKGLTGFDIMADKAGTQFKDVYDIVVGIGEQWDKLNDTEQAGLLEALAGKNQGNALAAALANVEKIKEIYNTAEYKSDGSAQRENEKYLDSINGKLNILESSFQSLSTTVVNSDFIKTAVDGLTILIDTIDSLINNLGLLGTIGVSAGVVGFFKNLDSFRNLGNVFDLFGGSFKNLKDFASLLDSLGGKSLSNIDKISSALKILSDAGESTKGISSIQTLSTIMKTFDGSDTAINSVVSAISGLSSESQVAVLSMFNLSEAQARTILTSVGLKGEMLETAVATVTSGTAAKGASVGFTAFAASVKSATVGLASFLLTNPVGWCILATGAIFGVVKAIDFFTESFEEAKEKAEDSRNAYENTASEVETLNSKLETTGKRIKELKAQGTLSITEQEELSNLEAQNEQLSRQLAIKEKLATYQQGVAAKDAENVLTKKSTYTTGKTVTTKDNYGNTIQSAEYKSGDIIDQTRDKQELLNEKTKEYNSLLYEKNQKKLESLDKQISDLNGEIADNLSEINNQYGSLFDEDGNVIEGYENTVERANKVIDQCTTSTNELEEAQNGVSESSKEASVSVESLSDNISNLSELQKNLNSALESSKSATGLTTEEITNLTNAYSELDSFDASKLFENTANGIHLNKEELARLNEELESSKLEEFGSKLKSLEQDLAEAMLNGEDTSGIEAEIEQVKQLQAQYEGLCSSYNKWLTAKSGGNERDSYESVGSGYKDMKEILNQGWYGDESLNAYLDLLLSASERTGDAQKDFEKLNKTISGTSHSLMDYWQFDGNNKLVTDGLFDFLDDVNKKFGDAYASIDESGKYAFDFTGDRLQEVADEFGTTTEMVQLFERAMIDAGMAVDLGDTESIDTLQEKLDSVNETLKETGKEPVNINVNVDNLDAVDSEIENAKNLVNSLTESDGTLRVGVEQSDYNNALSILTSLITKKSELQNPALMTVDWSSDPSSEIEKALGLLQQFKKDSDALDAKIKVGADTTEAQKKIQTDLNSINGLSDEIKTKLGLDDEDFKNKIASVKETNVDVEAGVNIKQEDIASIESTINAITPKMMVEAGVNREKVDTFLSEDKDDEAEVKYAVNDKAVVDFKKANHDIDANVKYKNVFKSQTPPPLYGGTAYYKAKVTGTAGVNGTAYINGTAYAKGNWGTKDSGIALGGELGVETIVRNGQFFTIGDSGAEFFQYKRGDIIFNHKQSEELFKYGKVTSGNGRGKALSNGTAFAEGTAFDTGSGANRRKKKTTTTSASKKSSSKSSSKKSSSKSKSSSSSDKAEESFDWIEVALQRIQEAFDRLKLIANNVYDTFASRNNALNKQLETVTKEISAQQKAYNAYMSKANSVGLSSEWKKKVQNGSYNISTVKDENLSKKIKEYQEW